VRIGLTRVRIGAGGEKIVGKGFNRGRRREPRTVRYRRARAGVTPG